jgi:hypothetical protein
MKMILEGYAYGFLSAELGVVLNLRLEVAMPGRNEAELPSGAEDLRLSFQSWPRKAPTEP